MLAVTHSLAASPFQSSRWNPLPVIIQKKSVKTTFAIKRERISYRHAKSRRSEFSARRFFHFIS